MSMKKLFCPKCNTKTAIYESALGKWRCHICGSVFDEYETKVIGNFKIKQGEDSRGVRYVIFEVEEDQYQIEKSGGKIRIKIFEYI